MGFAGKVKDYLLGYGVKEDEEDMFEEEMVDEDYDEPEIPRRRTSPTPRPLREVGSKNQIVSIHTSVSMQVVLSCPECLEDAGTVCDYLRDNKIVIVNLETVEHELSQRIVDFLGGVSYAIDGDIQSVSNKVFIIAPSNVDISGHFKEELKANGILFNFRNGLK